MYVNHHQGYEVSTHRAFLSIEQGLADIKRCSDGGRHSASDGATGHVHRGVVAAVRVPHVLAQLVNHEVATLGKYLFWLLV